MGSVRVIVRVRGLVVVLVVFVVFVVLAVLMIASAIVAVFVSMLMGGVIGSFMIVMSMAVIVMSMALVRVLYLGDRLIGAGVGLERRLYMADLGAKAAHHIFQHMIAAHAQPVVENLRLNVTIADVIGHAGQLARIAAAHFRQLFRRGHDLDQAPIFQNQRIAAAQHDGFGQIEQKLRPARGRHRHAAAMAPLVIQNDGVGGGRLPGALCADEIRADHAFPRSLLSDQRF